jgi:ketosteroid isomerase-like protein
MQLTRRVALISAGIVAIGAVSGQNAPAQSNDEKVVFHLEHDWSAAELKKDTAALDRIMTNDWSCISADGVTLTKVQYLASFAPADTRIDSQAVTELRLRFLGEVAVVTAVLIRRSERHGRDTSGHFIRTDVFVKRAGEWLAVESHESRIPVNPRP